MTERVDMDGPRAYWTWVARYLEAELEQAVDPGRRASIRHALYRVLAERLEQKREALSHLDAAAESARLESDVVWDAARAAWARDPVTRTAALSRLADLLEPPQEAATCLLDIAAIKESLSDQEGAIEAREEAAVRASEHRGVLLSQLLRAFADHDDGASIEAIERLVALTADPAWAATMLCERLSMLEERRAGADEIGEVLRRLLDLPDLDWALLNEVANAAETAGLFEHQERALSSMAQRAASAPPAPVEGMPQGHEEDGFEHTDAEVIGLLWRLAVVRERTGDMDGALDALNRALALAEDDVFLGMERSRILAAMNQPEKALEASPAEAPSAWKAELSLRAGRPELVADFVREARREAPSLEDDALAEIAASKAGDEEAARLSPETWLAANPHHPEAPAVAARIIETGGDNPVAALVLTEAGAERSDWPLAEDLAGREPWTAAVKAVFPPAGSSSEALSAWAAQTECGSAAALLTVAAADAAERDGRLQKAVELLSDVRDRLPNPAAADERLTRLLRELRRWPELAVHLERAASEGEGDVRTRDMALRALILEYALREIPGAVAQAESIPNARGDVATSFALLRLAVRRGDWLAAVETLDALARLCEADAPRLGLLGAEILLLASDRVHDAIERFLALIGCGDEEVSSAAVVYAAYALFSVGDEERLREVLGEEIRRAGRAAPWSTWLLEATRALRDTEALRRDRGELEPQTDGGLLWDLLGANDDPPRTLRAMAALSNDIEPGASCRLAATLLEGGEAQPIDEGDFGLLTAVWHAADRMPPDADPARRMDLLERRSALCDEGESGEWIDWTIERAEALEDAGRLDEALDLLRNAVVRFDAHPGLMEAQARIALAANEHVEAADAHGKLAGYYASQDQKATQLARAARIMLDHLHDLQGAERIAREAVRRSPSHDEAHEVLTDILRAMGDEEALARQIEQRIDAQEEQTGGQEDDALIALYEEQIDRLYAVDDLGGALEAVDKILFIAPDRLAAHRTKIDLMMGLGRWDDAVDAMFEFCFVCEDRGEIRAMTWQAAQVLADDVGDPRRAVDELFELIRQGDAHPQTERQLASIAIGAGLWEEAVAALGRLSELIKEPGKRAEVLKEKAQLQIEHLFDPDSASATLESALRLDPGYVDAVKLALQFKDDAQKELALDRARDALRERLTAAPLEQRLVRGLSEVARLSGRSADELVCRQALSILDRAASDRVALVAPSVQLAPPQTIALLTHRDELGTPAAEVARIAAPVLGEVFAAAGGVPPFGKATLVSKKAGDGVLDWLEGWAGFLGLPRFDLHRTGDDPRGCRPLFGEWPSVAVNPDVDGVKDAGIAFFLSRSLWRARAGLAAFEEGDAATPVRWLMALAAAVLGDDAGLPLPTDRDLVTRAKKELPRKIRKQLAQPCLALVGMDPMAIRAWVSATSFSADRFGLLVAGDLAAVVPLIVEEAAGPIGLRRLGDNPADALSKIPRCKELMRFAVAGDFIDLSQAVFAGRRVP